MPRVRMLIGISGSTSVGPGVSAGNLERGQIIEVDERTAEHWCHQGYAERRLEGPIGPAYKSEGQGQSSWR